MRIAILLFCICLVGCQEEDQIESGQLIIEARTSDFENVVQAQFVKRHNCYELQITEGVRLLKLWLENVEEGEYRFGRGELNNSIWLGRSYSNWEEERSGTLTIESRESGLISGNFEIDYKSELDNVTEKVVGSFNKLEVDESIRLGKSRGRGEINSETLGTSFSEMQDYVHMRVWQLYRPENEVLQVYLNKSNERVDRFSLNRDSIPVKNILPHIEYSLNSRLYTSSMGSGELEITEIDELNRKISCILNAELGNFQDGSILSIKEYEMELYYMR